MGLFAPTNQKREPSRGPNQPVVDPEHRATRAAQNAKLLAMLDSAASNIKDHKQYSGASVKRLLRRMGERLADEGFTL